ncbi:PepSY domain-containing protein [Dyella subtropica]|uniref:PepSY domain-containing protein n=1 Tax=Dyella subtropica TaxID=2992127 RepID=UPI002258B937|nr:PepSY domain-containing protein [Dyella subtropica]
MRLRTAVVSSLIALLALGAGTVTAGSASQAKLMAQAKVTESQAKETALAAVPGGSIASSELEREHGKLVWSFDIKTPGSKDITEIQVDAIGGKIVSNEKESPADQAKEAAADSKHHH